MKQHSLEKRIDESSNQHLVAKGRASSHLITYRNFSRLACMIFMAFQISGQAFAFPYQKIEEIEADAIQKKDDNDYDYTKDIQNKIFEKFTGLSSSSKDDANKITDVSGTNGGIVLLPAATLNISTLWIPPGVSLVGTLNEDGSLGTTLKQIPNSWVLDGEEVSAMIYIPPGPNAQNAHLVPRPHLENIVLDGSWKRDNNGGIEGWAQVQYAVLNGDSFPCNAIATASGATTSITATNGCLTVDGIFLPDVYNSLAQLSGDAIVIDVLINQDNTNANAIWRFKKNITGTWVYEKISDERNSSKYIRIAGGIKHGRTVRKNTTTDSQWKGLPPNSTEEKKAPSGILAASPYPRGSQENGYAYRSFTALNVVVKNVIGDGVVVEKGRHQTKLSNIAVTETGGSGFILAGSDMLINECTSNNTMGDSAHIAFGATPRLIGCTLYPPATFANLGHSDAIADNYVFSLRVRQVREFQFAQGSIYGQVYIDRKDPDTIDNTTEPAYQNIKFSNDKFYFVNRKTFGFTPMNTQGFINTYDVAAVSVLGSTYDGTTHNIEGSTVPPIAHMIDDSGITPTPGFMIYNNATGRIDCPFGENKCKANTVGSGSTGMINLTSIRDVRAVWGAKTNTSFHTVKVNKNDTDNTKTIQEQIDSIADPTNTNSDLRPAVIYFPTGTYNITSLRVPPGIALVGGNRTETVLHHIPNSWETTYVECDKGVQKTVTNTAHMVRVVTQLSIGNNCSSTAPTVIATKYDQLPAKSVVHIENMTLRSSSDDWDTPRGESPAAIYVEPVTDGSKYASITAYNVTIAKNIGNGIEVGKGRHHTRLHEVHTVNNGGKGMVFNAGDVVATRCGSGSNGNHSLELNSINGADFIGCEFWYPTTEETDTPVMPTIYALNSSNIRDSYGELNGQTSINNSTATFDTVNVKLNQAWNPTEGDGIFFSSNVSTLTLNDCAYLPDYSSALARRPLYIVEVDPDGEITTTINGGYLAQKGSAYYPLDNSGHFFSKCNQTNITGLYQYSNNELAEMTAGICPQQ